MTASVFFDNGTTFAGFYMHFPLFKTYHSQVLIILFLEYPQNLVITRSELLLYTVESIVQHLLPLPGVESTACCRCKKVSLKSELLDQ